MMTRGVAVARNSPAMVPEEVDVSVTPLVHEVGSFLSDVVGAAPLVAVEVAYSTDLMQAAGSPYDGLIPDDFVTVPDVVVFPENIELGALYHQ